TAPGDRPASQQNADQGTVFRQWASILRSWPIRQIEAGTQLSDEQHAALYEVTAAGRRRKAVAPRRRYGGTIMRLPKPVTPEEAMAVWSSIKNPSARSVARALSQAGRRVHHSTIARWCARGWRPVADRSHPVEAARQALDLAAGVLTGNPAAGMKLLEGRPEREQLDGLSDREVLRRSARELCISAILVCNEFQECASTLVAENPAEVALLLKALCGA